MPAKQKDQVVSSYGERYRSDPEFRERCLQRLKNKAPCPVCNKMITRVNLKRHKTTSKKCLAKSGLTESDSQ